MILLNQHRANNYAAIFPQEGHHMDIQNNRVASIHYTLTDNDNNVIDSSEGSEPLAFLTGAQNIIPGLENALIGKSKGDELSVSIEPKDGYGEHIPGMVQQAPISAFEGIDDLAVGMRFQAETDQGPVPVRVVAVEGDTVTVDGNHELAGVQLNFAVTVEDVREASAEELEHGHVHGPGGHHH